MSELHLKAFSNVHSHAFQRALRGRVQSKDPSRKDTFWTWRQAMYTLANELKHEEIESIARLCYMECLEAGYTAVGEFHYLHHAPDGSYWDDPLQTSRSITRAARDVGIRLNLLWTVYARGGFSKPLEDAQRRFKSHDLDHVRRSLDALQALYEEQRIHVGLALHSVRAVPEDWLGPLCDEARSRGFKIHAHVSEQILENEACIQATGMSPIRLLSKHGVLGPDFTAIHATWIDDVDLALLRDTNSLVGICPTTEGDLGDGVPRTADLHAHGVKLCIGSDSHAVIDPFCELRMLEYQARARTQSRCVLADEQGDVAPVLERIGSDYGRVSLGFQEAKDMIEIDSDATLIKGSVNRKETALMSGHPGMIRRVQIDGCDVVRDGRHVLR